MIPLKFEINNKELEKLNKWLKTKDIYKYSGTSGGRFTYSFTPTSIGTVITVSDAMEQKDKIDITDYENW